MAKEDILLREEMGRLEIEPIKLNRSISDENPFLLNSKRGILKKTSAQNGSCSCTLHKKNTNKGVHKRKQYKVLKEPVLQILKISVGHNAAERDECQQEENACTSQNIINLCTLVKNCNQLKISSDSNEQIKTKDANDKTKWWQNEVVCSRESPEQRLSSQTGSCSQQALNPPCDVTIDELASYFETLVHIPKKMSSMAEMMYI